jgi:hypothetical protein
VTATVKVVKLFRRNINYESASYSTCNCNETLTFV